MCSPTLPNAEATFQLFTDLKNTFFMHLMGLVCDFVACNPSENWFTKFLFVGCLAEFIRRDSPQSHRFQVVVV